MAAAIRAGAEPGAEDLRAGSPREAGIECELAAILGGHPEVAFQADGERNVVFAKEINPRAADELPVAEQAPDRRGVEDPEIAPQERNPIAGSAVAATVEHAPARAARASAA